MPPHESRLSSLSNPLIKEAASLHQKKYRDETGLILVEGIHPLQEALRVGYCIRHVLRLENTPLPELDIHQENIFAGLSIIEIPEKAMAKIATTASPPPIIAVAEKKLPLALSSLLRRESGVGGKATENPMLLLLDQLQDPGNLGALIRSAVAFDIDGVIMSGNTVDPWSPKVIRASAGLVFAIPVFCYENPPEKSLPDLISQLPEDFTVFLTTGHTAEWLPSDANGIIPYRQADFTRSGVLALGNEGSGLDPSLFSSGSHAHIQTLTIPMSAKVESLNVAVSGSIILAEIAAQRGIHAN